ncbi:MAG: 30S ribosomal protein S1 [Eubacterium sp.]|nr:30S ribosomal protein S1 [Eubacterium sp.]
MSEQSFEEMLNASVKTVRSGEVVEGTVFDVKPDQIILNIGTKADGILTRDEYSNDSSVDLTTVAKPGDTMEVKVLKVNDSEGQVLLTYKRLAAEKGNKKLEEAFEKGEVLKAKVVRVLTGGLSVLVDGARVFIPASLVSDTFEKDLNKYLDQEIEFKIIEFSPRRRRIIGDRKQLVSEVKKKAQEELLGRIAAGDTVDGVVKNITDFGAFIDLGGADGLLHISEMSWGRVDNPRSILKVGDEIRVLVKEIKGDRIALSMKFPEKNPWQTASEKYAAGTVVTGRVARMTDFGAFVELEPGVDALLHVSQISRDHVDKPSDVLSVGQEIEAKVVDFNGVDRKISLSMKVLQPEAAAPAEAEKAPVEEAPVEEAPVEEAPAEEAPAAETPSEETAEG